MAEPVECSLVDELPTRSLPARYGVARSQIYNRLNALRIETIKRSKNKSYVNRDQIALLDRMHELINSGASVEEAAAIVNSDTGQSYETTGQYLIHKPGPTVEQSHGTTGQLELLQALVAALADPLHGRIANQQSPSVPPAPPNPLSRFEQLQAIADHDWRPSTSELAEILGLTSLSGSTLERYGFRFTRVGRNGAQSAWRVEKIDD